MKPGGFRTDYATKRCLGNQGFERLSQIHCEIPGVLSRVSARPCLTSNAKAQSVGGL